MAKQTELTELLKAHRRAVYAFQNVLVQNSTYALRPGYTTAERKVHDDAAAVAFKEVDKFEKRIYSMFDQMAHELEVVKHQATENFKQLSALLDERNRFEGMITAAQAKGVVFGVEASPGGAFKWATAKLPTHESFDEAKARAGEPIEVRMTADTWIEKTFVGVFAAERGPMVCYLHGDKPDWAPRSSVRMAKRTEEVQMFANVYRGPNGAMHGTLNDSANKAVGHASLKAIATAFPVTVTVAK